MHKAWRDLRENLFTDVTEVPPMLQTSYLPSLDGFRGISILTVLIFHVQLKLDIACFHGDFGVEVFFVISGFIITTLLLKEKVKKNNIALGKFYIRRSLKIVPVAYLYLLVVTLLNLRYHYVAPAEIVSATLFIKNTHIIPTWMNGVTGHFWSLSVEEQFYVFFPFILAASTRKYFYTVLVMLVLIPAMLILEYKKTGVFKTPGMHIFIDLFRSFIPILLGSLSSLLIFKKVITGQFYRNTVVSNVLLLLLAYFLYAGITLPGFRLNTMWLSPVVISMVIINNIIPSNDLFFKFLNSKVLVTIGLASYSLYIWQQLFILQVPFPNAFPYSGSLWLNVPAALIAGFASYYFLEKRLARLKGRFR